MPHPTTPDPEYIYDPNDWEVTVPWSDRSDLIADTDFDIDKPKMFKTLIHGPDKWAAHIVLSWDDEGAPDETEVQWFDSEVEAQQAISASLATKG